jgi:hypothetical protein
MKKLILISALLYSLTVINTSVAGEIVDTEWSFNYVTVTYSPAHGKVECTVYNSSGAAIGGSESYARGNVARIMINVPKKYSGQNLKITCKEV